MLGLTNVAEAVRALDADEKMNIRISEFQTPGRGGDNGKRIVIDESGLYWLTIRSTKPEAKVFRRWITKEVLPTIRKTGRYEAAPTEMTDAEKMLTLAKGVIELNEKLEAAKPKVEAFQDHFIGTQDGTVNLSSAAKVP